PRRAKAHVAGTRAKPPQVVQTSRAHSRRKTSPTCCKSVARTRTNLFGGCRTFRSGRLFASPKRTFLTGFSNRNRKDSHASLQAGEQVVVLLDGERSDDPAFNGLYDPTGRRDHRQAMGDRASRST